jgi:CRP/FNR family cyclic AMP-dependent transcriptional regulator
MPPPLIDRRALLGSLELFSELAPTELDAVVAVTRAKVFAPREVVVRQGEPAEMAFAVVYGRLKVVTESGSGQEAVVGVLRKGEVFGELAILDGGARSATVIALAPTLLLAIDRRKLHALLLKEATVSYKLLLVFARRLRQLIGAREVLDVPARLAKQLMQLADDDGERVDGGVRLRTELSQRELGAMIGATRESVNKNLAALAKRGVVRSDGRQLVVVDLPALRAVAGGARGAAVRMRRARPLA